MFIAVNFFTKIGGKKPKFLSIGNGAEFWALMSVIWSPGLVWKKQIKLSITVYKK